MLQNIGSELFLISEYILDCKRYYRDFVEITWQDSDLRKWLNEDFYNTAFTAVEQSRIKTTHCSDNGEGTPDTEDRIFLLSAAELIALTELHGKDLRRAIGTPFAKAKKADGCRLYVYDKSVDANYLLADGQRHGCSWWWLRTRLGEPSRAAFVGTQASIRSYARVNRTGYGVRPALRLRLGE